MHHRFRSILAATTVTGLVFSMAACTPKPDVPDDVAEQFLTAFAERSDDVRQFTDNPDEASSQMSQTWDSLQAEGLNAELKDVQALNDQLRPVRLQLLQHDGQGGRDNSRSNEQDINRVFICGCVTSHCVSTFLCQ